MYINTNTEEYPIAYGDLKRLHKNTSFPASPVEEFNEYRLVHTSPIPSYDPHTQKLVEETPAVQEDGTYSQVYSVVAMLAGELSGALKAEKLKRKVAVTEKRYSVEIDHPTLDTTRPAQAMITGMWVAMQISPGRTLNFKGKTGAWSTLNKADFDSMADIAITWVEDCFNNEKALHDAIDASTTLAELEAIDIDSGWPS